MQSSVRCCARLIVVILPNAAPFHVTLLPMLYSCDACCSQALLRKDEKHPPLVPSGHKGGPGTRGSAAAMLAASGVSAATSGITAGGVHTTIHTQRMGSAGTAFPAAGTRYGSEDVSAHFSTDAFPSSQLSKWVRLHGVVGVNGVNGVNFHGRRGQCVSRNRCDMMPPLLPRSFCPFNSLHLPATYLRRNLATSTVTSASLQGVFLSLGVTRGRARPALGHRASFCGARVVDGACHAHQGLVTKLYEATGRCCAQIPPRSPLLCPPPPPLSLLTMSSTPCKL